LTVLWDLAPAQQHPGDVGQNSTAAEPQPGEYPPAFGSVVQGYEATVYGNEGEKLCSARQVMVGCASPTGFVAELINTT